jgi:hypothetical protein
VAEYGEELIAAWHTSHRVTVYLIENLPLELWSQSVPGNSRRTVRSVAAHIHNGRCMWIKMLGGKHGVAVPKSVDVRRVRPKELVRALSRSSEAASCRRHPGRTSPPTSRIFWPTSSRTRPTTAGSS